MFHGSLLGVLSDNPAELNSLFLSRLVAISFELSILSENHYPLRHVLLYVRDGHLLEWRWRNAKVFPCSTQAGSIRRLLLPPQFHIDQRVASPDGHRSEAKPWHVDCLG